MKKKINIRLIFVWMCVAFMVGYSVYTICSKYLFKEDESDEGSHIESDHVTFNSDRFENVLYEDDSIICYDDKVIYKYNIQMENIQKIADRVKGVLDRCSSLENVYVMPVPSHILIDTERTEEQSAYAQYIDELNSKMPEKGKLIDVLPILQEHKSEYIFFNTSNTWTARGAYYGMTKLAETKELSLITLDKYWEYSYNNFAGEMLMFEELNDISSVDGFIDHIHYYMYPNSHNLVEVIKEDDNGNVINVKKPLITPSYRNTGMFIDSKYLSAIVEGKSLNGSNDGKYLLVVTDDTGKIMTPYLKDYYDGVYVVSILRNYDLYDKINEIVEQYNITDMLYIQSVSTMGNEGYSRALNPFCVDNVKK